MKDACPSLPLIIQAQNGSLSHAKDILTLLCEKLTKKEALDEFESDYVLQCLQKLSVNNVKPYRNDPFNLIKKKDLSAKNVHGGKQYKEEVCYLEVTRLMKHHLAIMNWKDGYDDGSSIMIENYAAQYLDEGKPYAKNIYLDYSKPLTLIEAIDVMPILLKSHYDIELNGESVLTYYYNHVAYLNNKSCD